MLVIGWCLDRFIVLCWFWFGLGLYWFVCLFTCLLINWFLGAWWWFLFWVLLFVGCCLFVLFFELGLLFVVLSYYQSTVSCGCEWCYLFVDLVCVCSCVWFSIFSVYILNLLIDLVVLFFMFGFCCLDSDLIWCY